MTAFRRTTPDAEAVQYLPTDENPVAFSDEPRWLQEALQRRWIAPRLSGNPPAPALILVAHSGPALVHPGDWIVQHSFGRFSRSTAEDFARDYDLFEPPATAEPPTTAEPDAEEPAKAGADA